LVEIGFKQAEAGDLASRREEFHGERPQKLFRDITTSSSGQFVTHLFTEASEFRNSPHADPLTKHPNFDRVSRKQSGDRPMTQFRGTRITIETERVLMITHQQATRGWCKECGHEVEFLTTDRLNPWLEPKNSPVEENCGRLHLAHARDGLVICVKSLLSFLRAGSYRNSSQERRTYEK
jgi:hypothetical protein